jgi:hypothetical protein
MSEYLYGKRFGSKIAWANRKEDDRVGAGPSTETGCGGYRHAAYLLHIRAHGLHVGRYPPHPVSVLGPTSTLSPPFLLAQAIFEPNHFPYKCSNILKPSHYSYLSAYEDGTDSVPRGRHIKSRRWGITQKKAHNIEDTVKVWNQEYFKQACLTAWPVLRVGGCRSSVAAQQTCTAVGEHAVMSWGQELQCRVLL